MLNLSAKPQPRQALTGDRYEKRDANAKWIFRIVAFLFVAGISMHFILGGVLNRLVETNAPTDKWSGHHSRVFHSNPASSPRLQISPQTDLAEFQNRERLELNTYGWINKTAGIVRLPIDRAIDLILRRGLPARASTNGNQFGPSTYELLRQRPSSTQPEIQGPK